MSAAIIASIIRKWAIQIGLDEVQIRETTSNDFNHIMEVETLAFGYDKEAKLVAELLADSSAEPHLSLLALYKEEAIGHILLTKAYISNIIFILNIIAGIETVIYSITHTAF